MASLSFNNLQTDLADSIVRPGTPFEEFQRVDSSMPFFVKREDLCCDLGGAQSSKIRGVAQAVIETRSKKGAVPIGVVDIYKDCKAGWGVSYVCQRLDMPCVDFYPHYIEYNKKPKDFLPECQTHAYANGATIVPVKAGRLSVVFAYGAKAFKEHYPDGMMLPFSLSLPQTVDSVAREVVLHTPSQLLGGTWVISAGSGTIAAGVLSGLTKISTKTRLVAVMAYSANEDNFRAKILKKSSLSYDPGKALHVSNPGYTEYGALDTSDVPYPTNPHFDVKAYFWAMNNYFNVRPPIVIWNTGA